MNADELRAFKERLQAQAWDNYCFIRGYIEKQKAEIDTMPMPKLLKLIRLMRKSDDYIRIALGMPTTIKEERVSSEIKHTGKVTVLAELSEIELDRMKL